MTKPVEGSWTEELLNFSSLVPPPLLDTAEKFLSKKLCFLKTPPFLICFLRPERAACRDLLSFAQLQRKSFLSHKRHILFYQMIYVNDMHVSSLPSQSLLSVTFRLSKLLVFICVPTFHPDPCDKAHPSSFQASAGARPHLWPGRGFPLSQPLVSKRTPPFKHNS